VTELSDLLLTGVLNHGAAWLAVSFFLAALGIPLPATMLLLAAGAFVRQGVLPVEAALMAGIGGAVVGDAASYLIGRHALALLPQRWQGTASWQRAIEVFARWGSWSVFVTRFLLTPLALPVNLLAGSSRYAPGRFMAAVVAGEVAWVALFGGLGFWFADQWEGISDLAGDMVGLLAGGALVLTGVLLFVRSRARTPSPASIAAPE
jgi:membrane-associated protein